MIIECLPSTNWRRISQPQYDQYDYQFQLGASGDDQEAVQVLMAVGEPWKYPTVIKHGNGEFTIYKL